ncbi:ATP-binding cassette domain-containing protein [Nocardioides nematodiphilus]|uniref:ATP-binding cassette domain-containing protein n=1 Tax=Nocardioides nematodiphilus TaxID=2849669 RepID=UPI001CD9E736|nr:ATP-binding cassette domain-containing protein [Nocardioides nematodiphilus]MCA1984199.1 ATP-binding cassette domain-containing protein [Nocardioides nematodiphilus]
MSQHPTYDPADSVVRARGLCRRFTPDAGILDGVDLDLGAGEVVALVGRRGSGRASLLRALARQDREVVASGYLRLPERIALLGTSADAAPWKRTLEYVAAGVPGVATRRPARRALAEVGLLDAEASWAGDLSFLDQQRLALARVLAGEPELILADQPWQTLEPLGKLALHRALRYSAAERRTAVLMVTNDPDQVLEVADRVLVLEAGRIVEELPVPRHDHDARAAVRARVVERVGTPSRTETAPVEEHVTRRVTA